jgi:hypothetical protein
LDEDLEDEYYFEEEFEYEDYLVKILKMKII